MRSTRARASRSKEKGPEQGLKRTLHHSQKMGMKEQWVRSRLASLELPTARTRGTGKELPLACSRVASKKLPAVCARRKSVVTATARLQSYLQVLQLRLPANALLRLLPPLPTPPPLPLLPPMPLLLTPCQGQSTPSVPLRL